MLGSFFVFCLVSLLCLLFYFNSSGFLFTDDHFFHFKYAYLLRTHGFEINKLSDCIYLTNQAKDNTLQKTTLFHLALVPFTFIKDLEMGLKISDIFWASSALGIIYYAFRKLKIGYPFLLTLFIIAYRFPMERLLSGRNFVFSMGLVSLLIYFAIAKKYYKFFFISLFCIFWHPSIFFMPLIIATIAEIGRYLSFKKFSPKGFVGWLIAMFFVSLYFSFHTFFNLSVFFAKITSQKMLGEGIEIQKMDIFQIAAYSELFLCLFLLSFAFTFYVYFSNRNSSEKENVQNLLNIYVAFLFSLMTVAGAILLNGRFFDYYWMGVVFLVGSCIAYIKQKVGATETKLANFLLGGVFIFLSIIGTSTFTEIKRNAYLSDVTPNKLVAQWVASKSSAKDKVYLYYWSSFPVNFFFNDKNTYSMGMEPMQLFDYDEGLYWKWYNIFNRGIYCDIKKDCSEQAVSYSDLLKNSTDDQKNSMIKENGRKIIESIKNDFQAKYVISNNKTRDWFDSNQDLIADSFSAKSEISGSTVWGYKLK